MTLQQTLQRNQQKRELRQLCINSINESYAKGELTISEMDKAKIKLWMSDKYLCEYSAGILSNNYKYFNKRYAIGMINMGAVPVDFENAEFAMTENWK